MSAQSCCVTVCPGRDTTALHLLEHQDVALPCTLLTTSLLLEIHDSSWERSWERSCFQVGKEKCNSNWQLWRWTVVIYWILTVRFRHSQTSWLEKQHAAPSPQISPGHFKADLQAGTHTSWMLQTFHCTTVKYQDQFTVWGIFRALRKVFAGWQND